MTGPQLDGLTVAAVLREILGIPTGSRRDRPTNCPHLPIPGAGLSNRRRGGYRSRRRQIVVEHGGRGVDLSLRPTEYKRLYILQIATNHVIIGTDLVKRQIRREVGAQSHGSLERRDGRAA